MRFNRYQKDLFDRVSKSQGPYMIERSQLYGWVRGKRSMTNATWVGRRDFTTMESMIERAERYGQYTPGGYTQQTCLRVVKIEKSEVSTFDLDESTPWLSIIERVWLVPIHG